MTIQIECPVLVLLKIDEKKKLLSGDPVGMIILCALAYS